MSNAACPTIKSPADAHAWIADHGVVCGIKNRDCLDYQFDGDTLVMDVACSRCGGKGHLRGYAHYAGGICFGCNGEPTRSEIRVDVVAYAKKARQNYLARRRRQEKRIAEQTARNEAKLERQRNWCEANGYGRVTFEEKNAAQRAVSAHQGEVGDKVEVTGEVLVYTWVSGHYGDSLLVVLKDDAGNKFKFTTTSATLLETNRGDRITVKAVVKAHAEYRGEKQTVLTRCKKQDAAA